MATIFPHVKSLISSFFSFALLYLSCVSPWALNMTMELFGISSISWTNIIPFFSKSSITLSLCTNWPRQYIFFFSFANYSDFCMVYFAPAQNPLFSPIIISIVYFLSKKEHNVLYSARSSDACWIAFSVACVSLLAYSMVAANSSTVAT